MDSFLIVYLLIVSFLLQNAHHVVVSLQKLRDSKKEMNMAKGEAAYLRASLHFDRSAILHMEKELSTSNSKLGEVERKLGKLSTRCWGCSERLRASI